MENLGLPEGVATYNYHPINNVVSVHLRLHAVFSATTSFFKATDISADAEAQQRGIAQKGIETEKRSPPR